MAKKSQSPPKSFEDAMREIEQILADIEAGQIGLEESLARYERGMYLIQYCRGVCNAAEKQIGVISKSQDDSLQTQPLQETEPPVQA